MGTRNPADESASEGVGESEDGVESDSSTRNGDSPSENRVEAARSRRERAADDIERLFGFERLFGSIPHVRVSRLSDGEVRDGKR